MSKIVMVVNTMILDAEAIVDVVEKGSSFSNNEYFFGYKGIVWSVCRASSTAVMVTVYPDSTDPKSLAEVGGATVRRVTYSASEIGTREALESFIELFGIVKEKAYGVDDMFNRILDDAS